MTRNTTQSKAKLCKRVEFFVRKWAPRLGIDNYDIDVVVGPVLLHALAMTVGNNDSFRARITVPGDFYEEDPEINELGNHDLERTIVHELFHIVLVGPHDLAAETLDSCFGRGLLGETHIKHLNTEIELVCDKLAVALVRWDRAAKR